MFMRDNARFTLNETQEPNMRAPESYEQFITRFLANETQEPNMRVPESYNWEQFIRDVELDTRRAQQRAEERWRAYQAAWDDKNNDIESSADISDTELLNVCHGVVFIENSTEKCVICDEKCTMKTSCLHPFCKECVYQWFVKRKKNSCPYCRQSQK